MKEQKGHSYRSPSQEEVKERLRRAENPLISVHGAGVQRAYDS